MTDPSLIPPTVGDLVKRLAATTSMADALDVYAHEVLRLRQALTTAEQANEQHLNRANEEIARREQAQIAVSQLQDTVARQAVKLAAAEQARIALTENVKLQSHGRQLAEDNQIRWMRKAEVAEATIASHLALVERWKDGDPYDGCTCGHRREGHHIWGPCHACKCTAFIHDGIVRESTATLRARVQGLVTQWQGLVGRRSENSAEYRGGRNTALQQCADELAATLTEEG